MDSSALVASKADGLRPLLSHYQVAPLLTARQQGRVRARLSLDLGLSDLDVALETDGVLLPNGWRLGWSALEELCEQTNSCFFVSDDGLTPARGFSQSSQRTFQLMPTVREPAMLIAGFTMHRFKGTTPAQAAGAMVNALKPLRGRLLDTATGLGYAAIEAAKSADAVVTVELDPMAQQMARANPWSAALFHNTKITQLMGDSSELITTFEDGSFSAVLHDPPAINLAGELYAETFYCQVFRVLQRGGRFFHYIGDPNSASGGRTTKGVVRRLQSAGFGRIQPKPDAFGVLAVKER